MRLIGSLPWPGSGPLRQLRRRPGQPKKKKEKKPGRQGRARRLVNDRPKHLLGCGYRVLAC